MKRASRSACRWLCGVVVVGGCAIDTGGTLPPESPFESPPIQTNDLLISRVVDTADGAPTRFRYRHPDFSLTGSWVRSGPTDGYFDIRGERTVASDAPFEGYAVLQVREAWTRTVSGTWLVASVSGTRSEVTEEHGDDAVIGRETTTYRLQGPAEALHERVYWYDHTTTERAGNETTEVGRLEDWRVTYEDGAANFKTGEVTTFTRQIAEAGVSAVHEESYERTFWDGPPALGDWARHETSEVYWTQEAGLRTLHTTAIDSKARTWRLADDSWTIAGSEVGSTHHAMVRQPDEARLYDEVRNETTHVGERSGTTRFQQRRDYADLALTVVRDLVRLETRGDFSNAGTFYRQTEYNPADKSWTFRGTVRDTRADLDLALHFNALAELDALGADGADLAPWQGRDLAGVGRDYALLNDRERFFTVATRPIWERLPTAYPNFRSLTGR